MTTEIATLANIDKLCAGRDATIAGWIEHRAAYHETRERLGRLCPGFGSPLTSADYRDRERELHEAFMRAEASETFRDIITKHVDRACWSNLATITGALELMDRQAKEEWRASLDDPAPFTVDNCKATFSHLWASRRELFLRGIANAFSRLDRRFRSHDGFKVGSRLIIENALDVAGWSYPHWRNYERRDTFADVERILYELDGRPAPSRTESIAELISEVPTRDLPHVLQGDYFRVRIFKNGNLHIWFEREDILRQVNLLLAEHYGEAIGDAYNSTEAEDAPEYHATPAKRFGAFNTSPEIARRVVDWGEIWKGARVLEPSAGTGELAKAARDVGASVSCVEIQPGLAHELRVLHGFSDVREGDFLKLSPTTLGQFDVVLMNPPFDRGRDCDHVRHAWQFVRPGGKLVAIMSARAEFGTDKRHQALHKIVAEANAGRGRNPWWDLPPGSFAHAGTNVNTVCLILQKRPKKI